MKKAAFFIALFVGLNATVVVRKPEEDEKQAIVQKDSGTKSSVSLVQRITKGLLVYFYAITKEGRKDIISWDRIAKITSQKEKKQVLNGNKWVQVRYNFDGEDELFETSIY